MHRMTTERSLVPIAAVTGGLSVLLAAGCGPSASQPAAASVSPSPTATVNEFLSAFLKGHWAEAAQLTTKGRRGEKAVTAGQGELRALLVNQPPFTPVSALHWATHCSGLTCSVTFAPLNTNRVPELRLHLQAVGHHALVSIRDLSTWFTAIGHAGTVSPGS
jgi:hypothetical protein